MSKQISLFTYQVPDLGDVEDVISLLKKKKKENEKKTTTQPQLNPCTDL